MSEDRITNLEIKLSFTEDLIEKLNQIVYKQQQQIEFLYRELKSIKEQASSSGGGGSGTAGVRRYVGGCGQAGAQSGVHPRQPRADRDLAWPQRDELGQG